MAQIRGHFYLAFFVNDEENLSCGKLCCVVGLRIFKNVRSAGNCLGLQISIYFECYVFEISWTEYLCKYHAIVYKRKNYTAFEKYVEVTALMQVKSLISWFHNYRLF